MSQQKSVDNTIMLKSHILDAPIPRNLPKPLRPSLYKPKNEVQKKSIYQKIGEYFDPLWKRVKQTFNNNLKDIKDIFIRRNIKEDSRAIKGLIRKFTIKGGIEPTTVFNDNKSEIISHLESNTNIKVRFELVCNMKKVNLISGETINQKAYFTTKNQVNLQSTNREELFKKIMNDIIEKFVLYQERGSNWQLRNVVSLNIHHTSYNPISGSSYIPLPSYLKAKKALINMQNNDEECFKWSVVRGLNPTDSKPERITKLLKEQAKTLNFNDIEFPIDLKGIDKFEKQNNIFINVIGYENKQFFPYRLSNQEEGINLLLFSEEQKSHYVLIKNLSRLLSSTINKHKEKKHFCLNCFNAFRTKESLKEHKYYCNNNDPDNIVMPEKGASIQFKNYQREMKVPFVVYADFESILKPIHTCEPNPEESFTNIYQKHIPIGFCYYIKSDFMEFTPVTYTAKNENENVAKKFIEMLEKDVINIYHKTKFPRKIILNEEKFEKEENCWICGNSLGKDKVRDHCHYTGHYRGAAHNQCNLSYRKPKFIPVLFHNLSGYDSHLFIKNLGGEITCIPNNEESYISFSKQITVDSFKDKQGEEKNVKRELRFLDSYKFLSSPLSTLANNINCHPCVEKYIKPHELAVKKGIYPYDYISDLNKMKETQLPAKDKFYNILNGKGISDDEYQHAQNVWKTYNCKTFQDYHNLYNKTDVLLLADVFENFRKLCMNNYKLDPAWYYTSPGLAWDALLKITKVNLELIHDRQILDIIENGIRGGVAMISKRYSEANSPDIANYNPKKENVNISYIDANNLYGWAMSKKLPTHNFKLMNDDDLEEWRKHSCILVVDLEYPDNLHDLHNDLPLAPERLMVNKVEKLIPNLNNKNRYTLHHVNLKQYLDLGLKLTKIHSGVKFEESNWMEPYIMLNTNLRQNAKNPFEKDFFKLMNNSVFGKTIENIRNRVDIKLVSTEKQVRKLSSKINFEKATIFSESLVAVHMKRLRIRFDKPVYLGMSILDISKTLMFDMHYNFIKKKFDANLLFTDTDSLAYEVKIDNIKRDMYTKYDDLFDTSNYPANSKYHNEKNKAVLGKFKDEAGGRAIIKFVGLRPKLYSYVMNSGVEKKTCKGIKTNVIKNDITFNDYLTCLKTRKEKMVKVNNIRNHKHELYSERMNKIALSANDDKRHICEDGVNTLAYGHYLIRK